MQSLILEALTKSSCSILPASAQLELPPDSNSLVRYSLWRLSKEALEAAAPVFTKAYEKTSSITEAYPFLQHKQFTVVDLLQCGSNYVQIFGEAPEPLHIHASTIIVHVVQGMGVFFYEEDGVRKMSEVHEGDTIVIPVGAPHFFHGKPLVTYTGIEFGPILDYQKHHYHERLPC